ncbi:aquaporin Z [Anabaena sp. CCY 0017]|uniref:aquaporin Z n=1 Tax=Anabaena sp. CCY 0017 TaxID=3103866 RepID=UPI0039C6D0BF
MSLIKRSLAEFIGTFWLVLGGCGSAVLAAAYTTESAKISVNTSFPLGIGLVGVSLAFGLTVLTGAYALGHISGGHFNPAVSFGLWVGKRFPGSDLLPYIASQVLGATLGGAVTYLIASGQAGFVLTGSNPLATNGFGIHSPGGYNLFACFITEVVMTFMFLLIILGVTDRLAPKGFAPLAIGLALTLIHLISIPVTNTSVNPARSTGVAIFAGTQIFSQVWLFWVAPILGAILAGWFYLKVFSEAPVDVQQNIEELV